MRTRVRFDVATTLRENRDEFLTGMIEQNPLQAQDRLRAPFRLAEVNVWDREHSTVVPFAKLRAMMKAQQTDEPNLDEHTAGVLLLRVPARRLLRIRLYRAGE